LPPRLDPIRAALDEAAARAGVQLAVEAEFAAFEDIVSAVRTLGLHAVLPRYAVDRAARDGGIAAATLVKPRMPICLFVMTARDRTVSRATATARQVLVHTVEELVRTDRWPGRYVGYVDSDVSMVSIYTNPANH